MKLYRFSDTRSNMEDREERRRRERAKRERCKEVPRGSISPASQHINRSQPYYSQSKGDENRKKNPLEKRGKGAKSTGENPQNRATTLEFSMRQEKWSLSVKRELSSHVQKTSHQLYFPLVGDGSIFLRIVTQEQMCRRDIK